MQGASPRGPRNHTPFSGEASDHIGLRKESKEVTNEHCPRGGKIPENKRKQRASNSEPCEKGLAGTLEQNFGKRGGGGEGGGGGGGL